jgi:alkylhydroperoxidase family enzyme
MYELSGGVNAHAERPAGVRHRRRHDGMTARIPPVDEATTTTDVQERFARAEQRGAPNAMLLRILARDPNSLSAFYDAWNRVFYDGGQVDHGLKEIVRVRMARLRSCGY